MRNVPFGSNGIHAGPQDSQNESRDMRMMRMELHRRGLLLAETAREREALAQKWQECHQNNLLLQKANDDISFEMDRLAQEKFDLVTSAQRNKDEIERLHGEIGVLRCANERLESERLEVVEVNANEEQVASLRSLATQLFNESVDHKNVPTSNFMRLFIPKSNLQICHFKFASLKYYLIRVRFKL
jgi:chromosome segregation ATPase